MILSPPSRVLLGVTGSIGAAFAPGVVYALRALWSAEVRVVITAAAAQFVTPTALAIASHNRVLTAAREDATSGTVPHLELTRWAELVLVAPATANTLCAVAAGSASDPLTTAILAAHGPVVLAPSMNDIMWAKPAVQRNVRTIRGDGIGVIEPTSGPAAHDGAVGSGAMPPVPDLLDAALQWLASREHGMRDAS